MIEKMSAHTEEINEIFSPELCIRINDAVQRFPDLQSLFQDIAHHAKATTSISASGNNKKRKLEDITAETPAQESGTNGTNGTQIPAAIKRPITAFVCEDVSFQVPRKKLKLHFVRDVQDDRRQEVRLQHPITTQAEHTLPADQIEAAFCLPLPEKQKRQWNFVLFPKPGSKTLEGKACEQVVFLMDEAKPKPYQKETFGMPITENDTFVTITERALNSMLQPQGKHVVIPSADEFASSIPQPHRKGEKAYHVKAYRGSKDGYLFFLPSGIVFGFKKPLAFFPFSTIEAISYTAVLQRTFNLVITTREANAAADDTTDVEFSMIDQADFAGIDEYIKRHGLNDASMAAARRAKVHGVNKTKKNGEEVNGGAEGEDGHTELQKAEQQLQDEEDEEEEDYVESGGESDGEGEYSDDDEEAEGGGGELIEEDEEMDDD